MGWVSAIMSGVGAANEVYDNSKTTQLSVAEQKDNQQMAYEASADAVRRGNIESGQTKIAGGKLVGEQKVAYANSGVDATVGTPASVIADTRAISDIDAKTAQNNAAREAWGFRKHGVKYGQQASLEAVRGSNKNTASILGGVGGVARGIGSEWSKD